MKRVLVTGSGGLIGSEAVRFFAARGFETYGIDNDLRSYFFGAAASTRWNLERLKDEIPTYRHFSVDIRTPPALTEIFQEHRFDLIIHTAAQPSHDWAAKEPITDFGINAYGTLLLLEKCRKYCPEAVFIFTSTNKVYGDRPNTLPLIELATRYELPPEHRYYQGIDESMSLDDSLHSLMGASKVSADIMVQEYGKYFGLKTGVFRGGCLTGPAHSGTQLHGFLAYLIKCLATGEPYTIFGYKGKQVRDNIHSYDLINAFYHFYQNPRSGEAYNIGGSRYAHTSILEAVKKIEAILGRKANLNYIDQPRKGDHIWYISDVSKFQRHYPDWHYEYNLERTLEEICYSGYFASTASGASTISFFSKDPQLASAKLGKTFLAGHVDKAFGPIQALRLYLSSASEGLVYAEHSLFKTSHHLLNVFKDLYLNLKWFRINRQNVQTFIGVNNVNAFSGALLKLTGFRGKLIYFATDYSPQRFSNPVINRIYHLADRLCLRLADAVWSTTPEVKDLRRRQGLPESKNILVRSGVLEETATNLKKNESERQLTSLIINGFLTPQPLVELTMRAAKDLVEKFPAITLQIIVGYLNREALQTYTQRLGLDDRVGFWEGVPHQKISHLYQKGGVGLGLFQISKEKPALYHDPVEIKEFLAAGLPVICSQGIALSREIVTQEAGIAISNREEELFRAVSSLLLDEAKYLHLSQKAIEYAHHLPWQEILAQAFRGSGLIPTQVMDISKKRLIIVVHYLVYGAPQALREYLINSKVGELVFIAHPLYVEGTDHSYIEIIKDGQTITKKSSPLRTKISILNYFLEACLTFWWVLSQKGQFEVIFGADCLNALAGIWLRWLGKAKKVVFYTIDFSPERFTQPLLNKIYHRIEKFCVKHADEVWDVSPRVAEGRKKLLGLEYAAKCRVVPIGIWFDKVKRRPFSEIKKHQLLFLGHLLEKQGAQLVLAAMPDIIKEIPDFHFLIIGGGPYEEELKKITANLQLNDHVTFTGWVKEREKLDVLVPESACAIAPYDPTKAGYTYYADPTKIKDYLSAGLSVILTEVAHNARELEKEGCGLVIGYNQEDIAKAVIQMLRDETMLQKFRDNAVRYIEQFDWDKIFSPHFSTF